jgi:hypothetical protein
MTSEDEIIEILKNIESVKRKLLSLLKRLQNGTV